MSGVYTSPSLPVCTPFPEFAFTPNATVLNATPQTEAMNYSDGDVQTIVNFRGHGVLVYLMRTFVDQATGNTFQTIIHPVRLYDSAIISLAAANDTATLSAQMGGDIGVLANDAMGSVTANEFGVTPTVVSAGGLTGLSFVGPNLRVPGGQTATGTRMVTYQICQAVTNTTNCQTATVAITLIANVVANNDTATVSPAGGTITVLGNDTINGLAATTSNVSVNIVTTGGLFMPFFIGGVLNINSGETVGSYNPTYQICDSTDPMNCSTATVNVTVANAPIVANADAATVTTGGGVVSVLANDTLNGLPATNANVTFTLLSAGGANMPSFMGNGQLSFPVPQVAGTYNPQYRICEIAVPMNCATANLNLTVTPGIVATPDTAVVIAGAGGTVSVLSNDTLYGAPANSSTVTTNIQNDGGLTTVSVNAAGQLVVPPGTPVATYMVTYRICEIAQPIHCTTAIAAISVSNVFVAAVADSGTINPSGSTVNILANDTVNATPANVATNADVALISNGGIGGASIDGAGVLVIPSGVTAGGYTLAYRLCAKATMVCQNANVTLNVLAALGGNADTASLTIDGGTVNILSNDTIGGAAATTSNADVTLTANGGISSASINTSGQLILSATLTPGNYTLTYQLCQKSTSNCTSVTVTVSVAQPATAVNDTATVTGGGGTVNILANDLINGAQATTANADVTIVSVGNATGAAINASGQLAIPGGLVQGTYAIQYRLCQKGTTRCANATANVTVNVSAGQLGVSNDRAALPPSGGNLSLSANDTFDGRRPQSNELVYTLISNGGINTLNITAAGEMNVPRGLAPGAYQITYKACQRQLPTNCATATVFITITQSVTSVVTNRPPSVPGAPPPSTTVTIVGPGGSPITFVTGSSSNVAGSINDPIVFSDVKLVFGESESGVTQKFYQQDDAFDTFGAQFYYSGAGVIRGRWEVVYPGDPLPTEIDLFTEASLPAALRQQQQRYFQIERVQQFLPPTGRYFLKGPDPARLPRNQLGQYLILLRLEAVSGTAGAGFGGGSAPFPLPVLEYSLNTGPGGFGDFTGGGVGGFGGAGYKAGLRGQGAQGGEQAGLGDIPRGALALENSAWRYGMPGMRGPKLGPQPLAQMLPQEGASIARDRPIELRWTDAPDGASYRVEVETAGGKPVVSAAVKPGVSMYAISPALLDEIPPGTFVRWRVMAFNFSSKKSAESPWRALKID
ncbi:MAG: hypothetical protein JNJ55_11315 [Betaproteobacteria bacterium]|nr:hypothetical protein [Betaproteobacteria bacterium]